MPIDPATHEELAVYTAEKMIDRVMNAGYEGELLEMLLAAGAQTFTTDSRGLWT